MPFPKPTWSTNKGPGRSIVLLKRRGYLSYSLNSLKGDSIGVTVEDTSSLDCSSYRF